ncbi:tRNA 2-thiouridine(34) synthase MnmA [Patescibacteria group bacterium]|nr:tRNA 2-thiouridine(34) synthase MnmA [Patescibacteria group bacterium]MBU1931407.1 tRNA 2-thiouridine(34) synthase MnmA [Patescibacteria group bacterium]
MKKIAVGLSGGVDSALAAALLKEQGYDLLGIHIHLWSERNCNRCCGNKLLTAARQTAELLGIPFYEIDLKKEFKAKVVDNFIKEYRLGRTPNPCILCNKFIRFGQLLEIVNKRFGCDYLATGHYARIVKTSCKRSYHLLRAKDLSKDQSYFLYSLDQKQLSQLIFPLGEWHKEKVWQEAKKRQLPAAESPESFDLCFTDNLENFLQRQLKPKPGEVIVQAGEVIGQHKGLPFYTFGQSGGWQWLPQAQKKLSQTGKLPKFYVVAKDMKKNQLIVGGKITASSKVFSIRELLITDYCLPTTKLFVKIRNTGKLLPCQLKDNQVILDKPAFAVAPGQSAGFYRKFKDDYEVIGGGIIN